MSNILFDLNSKFPPYRVMVKLTTIMDHYSIRLELLALDIVENVDWHIGQYRWDDNPEYHILFADLDHALMFKLAR